MKLSGDFLAAASSSPSVFFPFGRQATLKHMPSFTFRLWIGVFWFLSIDQIYGKQNMLKMTRPFQWAYQHYFTFIHPWPEQPAKYFVLSFHTISWIQTLIKKKRIESKTIICNYIGKWVNKTNVVFQSFDNFCSWHRLVNLPNFDSAIL
jgi:hypothetical protein